MTDRLYKIGFFLRYWSFKIRKFPKRFQKRVYWLYLKTFRRYWYDYLEKKIAQYTKLLTDQVDRFIAYGDTIQKEGVSK